MPAQHGGRIYAGIVMHIRDTDGKGFFKGEFDFGEREMNNAQGDPFGEMRTDGIFTFMGKINFRLNWNVKRHPFRPDQNRIYKSTLYIVDRLDFDFDTYQIETYLRAEYDIVHYREMQVMRFTLRKTHRQGGSALPSKFTLYKKMGASFEPYSNVKQVVFRNDTRCDS